jgi:hypothetical protein
MTRVIRSTSYEYFEDTLQMELFQDCDQSQALVLTVLKRRVLLAECSPSSDARILTSLRRKKYTRCLHILIIPLKSPINYFFNEIFGRL